MSLTVKRKGPKFDPVNLDWGKLFECEWPGLGWSVCMRVKNGDDAWAVFLENGRCLNDSDLKELRFRKFSGEVTLTNEDQP